MDKFQNIETVIHLAKTFRIDKPQVLRNIGSSFPSYYLLS
jgi:hypothetical protein